MTYLIIQMFDLGDSCHFQRILDYRLLMEIIVPIILNRSLLRPTVSSCADYSLMRVNVIDSRIFQITFHNTNTAKIFWILSQFEVKITFLRLSRASLSPCIRCRSRQFARFLRSIAFDFTPSVGFRDVEEDEEVEDIAKKRGKNFWNRNFWKIARLWFTWGKCLMNETIFAYRAIFAYSKKI